MRVLFVHPSPLMYSELFLRLEPLGLERVAAAARAAGAEVRVEASVRAAIDAARSFAGEGDAIVVTGSLFTVADAKRSLG
jgi:magnesium-protoporphyrin IX monomethyl ester (oxidative) cyclase